MKILALEFSSAQRSVAVACGASQVHEVRETASGHTMLPFRMIDAALAQADLRREEIECLVVGLGPGSYGGIRVGIALAQGWQLARDVKLLGVSSAEAIAAQAQADGWRGTVNVIVDAQRGELYLGTWALSDAGHVSVKPLRITGVGEVKAHAEAGQLVIGPEATRWIPSGKVVFARAAMLAKLAAGRTDFRSGEALEPIYLRETTFVKAPPARIV